MKNVNSRNPLPPPPPRLKGAPERTQQKGEGETKKYKDPVPLNVRRYLDGYKLRLTNRSFEKEIRQKLGLFRPK